MVRRKPFSLFPLFPVNPKKQKKNAIWMLPLKNDPMPRFCSFCQKTNKKKKKKKEHNNYTLKRSSLWVEKQMQSSDNLDKWVSMHIREQLRLSKGVTMSSVITQKNTFGWGVQTSPKDSHAHTLTRSHTRPKSIATVWPGRTSKQNRQKGRTGF